MITANSAAGKRRETNREPKTKPTSAAENAAVVHEIPPRSWNTELTSSIVGTCFHATWTPTPVRNPMSTLRERKSARNPSRRRRPSTRKMPVMIASTPASPTYSGDAEGASGRRAAAMITAVAESAPTTRWRDEPNSANTEIGRRIVARPVSSGMCAIWA